jgi:hypothetical protein
VGQAHRVDGGDTAEVVPVVRPRRRQRHGHRQAARERQAAAPARLCTWHLSSAAPAVFFTGSDAGF